MRFSSLTSQIIEVTGWALPSACRILNGAVIVDYEVDTSAPNTQIKIAQEFRAARTEMLKTRRGLRSWRAGEWRHMRLHPYVMHAILSLRARRRELLRDLRALRAAHHAAKHATDAAGTVRGARHGALTQADVIRVSSAVAHGGDEDVVRLVQHGGDLTPVPHAASSTTASVLALCRSYTESVDLIGLRLAREVTRGAVLRTARALDEIGRHLPVVEGYAFGLLQLNSYPRDLDEHARDAIRMTLEAWRELYLGDFGVTWHQGAPAFAARASFGAALAVDLLRRASGASTMPVCATCGRFFTFGAGHRRPREGAPQNCPKCRKTGRARKRSDRRERIVQLIRTRLDREMPGAAIMQDIASRLEDGDDFGDMLARARLRAPRASKTR